MLCKKQNFSHYILVIVFAIALFACSPKTNNPKAVENSITETTTPIRKNQKTTYARKTPIADSILSPKEEAKNTVDTENIANDCIRGQAEPIVKKAVFPKTQFAIQPDNISAIETVFFDNGDKLIINHLGCEYYTLSFRFETSRFHKEKTDTSFWYEKTALLINELEKGIDAPLEIKKGIEKLTEVAKKNKSSLKYGEEIDFGGNEIREFVTLDGIEKINKNKFAVTITFSAGPL